MTSLAIRTHTIDRVLHVDVSGEIDMSNSDEFTTATRDAATRDGLETIVVDLSQVSFMDSSGIRALVLAREQAAARGVGFLVADPSRPVGRVLELTGLLPLLTSDRSSASHSC